MQEGGAGVTTVFDGLIAHHKAVLDSHDERVRVGATRDAVSKATVRLAGVIQDIANFDDEMSNRLVTRPDGELEATDEAEPVLQAALSATAELSAELGALGGGELSAMEERLRGSVALLPTLSMAVRPRPVAAPPGESHSQLIQYKQFKSVCMSNCY